MLASSTMRVRDRSLGDSFRRFLVGEKTTSLFSFDKGETCPFLVRTRKERKETANVPFDRLRDWQRFDGGYERRRPRSRSSRDPSIAAAFVDIVSEGAHTARALHLRPRDSQSHGLFARRMTESARRCAVPSVGSRGYTLSQQKHGSLKR